MRLINHQDGLYGIKGLEERETQNRAIQERRRCRLVPSPQYYLITRTALKLCFASFPQVEGGKKCAWIVL